MFTRGSLTTFILLLVLAAPVFADAEADFAAQAERTRQAVASLHVSLARQAKRLGLNVDARAELHKALELVPEHESAMSELGFRKRRVDGQEKWVLDERRALPEANADDIPDTTRKRLHDLRERMLRDAAAEFIKLAQYARERELAVHARVAFAAAVAYQPDNEEARLGSGWRKLESGGWISAAEHAEQQATTKALQDAPEAAALDELPAWTSRVFGAGLWGVKVGGISVIGTGTQHREVAKHCHAALALSAALLGGAAGELRIVLCASEEEFRKYCEVRHPGAPGLALGTRVIEKTEIAVLLTETGSASLSRAVYAATIAAVRRRCEEPRHPWFEMGFAVNMARRLSGNVSAAEFAGEGGERDAARWKKLLIEKQASGEAPALIDAVINRDPGEVAFVTAYFFTQYLSRERASGLPAFCSALRTDSDSEAALMAAYDADVSALEAAFKEWLRLEGSGN